MYAECYPVDGGTRKLYNCARPVDSPPGKEEKSESQPASPSFPFKDLGNKVQQKVLVADDDYFVEKGHSGAINDVLIPEIVTPKDPAFDQLKADGAISDELNGLLYMNAVRNVLASEAPNHSNVVGTRIVLDIKEFATDEKRCKETF